MDGLVAVFCICSVCLYVSIVVLHGCCLPKLRLIYRSLSHSIPLPSHSIPLPSPSLPLLPSPCFPPSPSFIHHVLLLSHACSYVIEVASLYKRSCISHVRYHLSVLWLPSPLSARNCCPSDPNHTSLMSFVARLDRTGYL